MTLFTPENVEQFLSEQGAANIKNYLLMDKGEGSIIEKWPQGVKKPTLQDLERIEAARMAALEAVRYKKLRSDNYPNIGDQLDAIWKQLNAMRLNGENLVQDADNMLGKVLSVKQRFPKPEGK